MLDSDMTNSGQLLIVDHDRHVLRLLRRVVQSAGLRAIPLADAALALDVAAERQPDVIVLGVELADSAGRDVLTYIKTDPRTRSIPVFVHTKRGASSDRVVALELGADDYFEKPYNLGTLLGRILKHLKSQPT